ncbi:hypothetical protein D3C85_1602510 [compost metagenome]
MQTQKRQACSASLSIMPGNLRTVSLTCAATRRVAATGSSQRSASGRAKSTGSRPSARKPACQPQRVTAQVVISGRAIAARPEPLRMMARASPRFSSNHRLTRCDQVICRVPTPANGTRKNPR